MSDLLTSIPLPLLRDATFLVRDAATLVWWTKVLVQVFIVVIIYKAFGRFLRNAILVPKLTILHDLPNLGRTRDDGKLGRRAVVCGGSVAGLFAAAVCAEHYESVIIIEPDETGKPTGESLPPQWATRTTSDGLQTPVSSRHRVLQYFQFHFFQPPCYMILDRLFPNLHMELDRLGLGPIVARLRLRYGGTFLEDPYTTSDVTSGAPLTLPISREAYETLVRNLVKTKRNIQFSTGTVLGFTRSSSRLRGVKVRYPGREVEVSGDFVVDATGQTRLGARKALPAAGFPIPPELHVQYDPHVQYSTSTWTIPPRLHASWPGPTPIQGGLTYYYVPDSAAGECKNLLIGAVENGRVQIICGGPGVLDRPHSIQEIRSYIKDLHGTPEWLCDMIDLLEMHEEECRPTWADVTTKPANWIQYHKVEGLPPNFVAVGDAVMNLNPAYGQGVTKAAVDATTLDAVLRNIPTATASQHSISRAFFKKQLSRISGFWHTTRWMDYGFETTTPMDGETLETGSLFRKLARHIVHTAAEDPEVYSVRFHCNMTLAPATDTFAPWVLLRVARRWITA